MSRSKVFWIGVGALAALLVVVQQLAVATFKQYRIASGAMEPALAKGDRVLMKRTNDIRRGDLVVYQNKGYVVVKRAIGLAGDTIEIRDKRVLLNGAPLTEPYIRHDDPDVIPNSPVYPEPYGSRDQFGPLRVPNDALFVLGDNRDLSNDSRYHGPVSSSDVLGRVVVIYSRGSIRGVTRPPTSGAEPKK